MKILPSLSHLTLAAAVMSLSAVAYAHDSTLHEQNSAPKAKPSTCRQLADTEHYLVDLKDSATKALKARCDAAKKPITPISETPDKK